MTVRQLRYNLIPYIDGNDESEYCWVVAFFGGSGEVRDVRNSFLEESMDVRDFGRVFKISGSGECFLNVVHFHSQNKNANGFKIDYELIRDRDLSDSRSRRWWEDYVKRIS